MSFVRLRHLALVPVALVVAAALASGQDWPNYGGNDQRNGQSTASGPTALDLLWENDDDWSIIAWHPFVEGDRVFTVREAGFPVNGGAANDAILAYDLDTGTELWRTTLPWGGNTATEWIAWIGGVKNGLVYASRSANQQPNPILALDVATGAVVWTSTHLTEAWAHDGIVFAPNGDLIIGEFRAITRIDATDGSTVWSVPRSCPVSGNCGVAATDTFAYYDESAPGGNIISKLDLATGAYLYSSALMSGFTDQNGPFVSPDGTTVYFSRTQNNTATDFLYAFLDTGTGFTELWHEPVRWTTSHEHGIGADGSIYTFSPLDELVRLDPLTGTVLSNAGVLSPLGSPNLSPKTAVDAFGTVYVSNGWASNPATDGRLWAFSADLSTNVFTLNLDRQNAGGPVLGRDGTLIVCDRQAVYAYRSDNAASATFRNAGTNPQSYLASPPVLGATFDGSVDLAGTTGHGLAWLVGFSAPATITLGGGQTLLVDVTDPNGELLAQPVLPGPVAAFQAAVPLDYVLCGFSVSTQALHVGGVQPYALSNAYDLVLGTH